MQYLLSCAKNLGFRATASRKVAVRARQLADSEEVTPAYRDDLALGFRHDVAPWAGAAGDGIVGAELAFVNVLLI